MSTAFQTFSKESRFCDLVESVRHCNLCPRLCSRTKVLSEGNGDIDSKVLFVAEAPGRLGADRTGIPLHGDQTGDNFEALLGNIGWRREDLFITNAVLCNPREENGNNATPTSEEIGNCSAYLEMTIELVDPVVVVPLGATALAALAKIVPHGLDLKGSVAKPFPWAGRTLVPLYHPGPRARVHRSLLRQRADFMSLAKLSDPRRGIRKRPKRRKSKKVNLDPRKPAPLHEAALAFVDALGRMTYFKLTKLLYFLDLLALERLGCSVTGEIYLRQQEGPWPPKLRDAVSALDGYELRQYFARRIPMVAPGPSPRFPVMLDDESLGILVEVLERYGHMSNAAIKTAAYRSAPMRYVLGQEKQGRDMRKVPLIYKDKTAAEIDAGDAG